MVSENDGRLMVELHEIALDEKKHMYKKTKTMELEGWLQIQQTSQLL